MNTRTSTQINLQVGQQVVRNDGFLGHVVSTDGDFFEVLWNNDTKYHYRANGRWCGSWGVDQCSLDVQSVGHPRHSAPDEKPLADKLDIVCNYALGFGWGLVAGVVLQYFWPL
jgi:hypothetical protein